MNARLIAAIGVALTTGLLVAVALTEALSTQIAFSALVGLPIGLAAGVVAGAAVWIRLWRSPRSRPVLLGAATFGYAILVAATVSYAVPPARDLVGVTTAVPFAVLCAVAVALVAQRYPDRIS